MLVHVLVLGEACSCQYLQSTLLEDLEQHKLPDTECPLGQNDHGSQRNRMSRFGLGTHQGKTPEVQSSPIPPALRTFRWLGHGSDRNGIFQCPEQLERALVLEGPSGCVYRGESGPQAIDGFRITALSHKAAGLRPQDSPGEDCRVGMLSLESCQPRPGFGNLSFVDVNLDVQEFQIRLVLEEA